MVDMVYHMAGNVRREFKCSVTHLVANVIGGEKYDVRTTTSINSEFYASLISQQNYKLGQKKYLCLGTKPYLNFLFFQVFWKKIKF